MILATSAGVVSTVAQRHGDGRLDDGGQPLAVHHVPRAEHLVARHEVRERLLDHVGGTSAGNQNITGSRYSLLPGFIRSSTQNRSCAWESGTRASAGSGSIGWARRRPAQQLRLPRAVVV